MQAVTIVQEYLILTIDIFTYTYSYHMKQLLMVHRILQIMSPMEDN